MPEANTISFVWKDEEKKAIESQCVGVCERVGGVDRDGIRYTNSNVKNIYVKKERWERKTTPVQRLKVCCVELLPWEKDDSHWQRISWLEVCHIAAPTSLSVSDCTQQSHDLFQPQQQQGSACREAVLDTNLSFANKSQTHQPEYYSWQSTLVDYERQIVQQGQRTTRGVLQQPLQWLVNIMFAFCIIFTCCGFLFLIGCTNWVNQRSECCTLQQMVDLLLWT